MWPDAKFAALGAFMFLRSVKLRFCASSWIPVVRFISPAIVSPETIDIELPNETYRRGCMVIAKIIQNMANNIFFGKEVHMTVLNDFLGEHIADVTRYLSSINVGGSLYIKSPLIALATTEWGSWGGRLARYHNGWHWYHRSASIFRQTCGQDWERVAQHFTNFRRRCLRYQW